MQFAFLPAAGRRPRPWFALRSGAWAGQALPAPVRDTAAGIAASVAEACALAGSTSRGVSLAAAGDLVRWPGAVGSALARSGLRPERLQVTVEARQVRDGGVAARRALVRLREQGVGVGLRGFGPATIGLVDRLPLTAVILAPGEFRLPLTPPVLHAVIQLALARRLTILAAGIETEPQRALLSGLGCHFGEGGLFGTGVPPQNGEGHERGTCGPGRSAPASAA